MKVFRVILVALLLVVVFSTTEGNVVRLCKTDVVLNDLPPVFDGTKILFVSDIHASEVNPSGKVRRLASELKRLEPDIVLLGGDLAGKNVLPNNSATAYDMVTEIVETFGEYEAPMGKYAVRGDMDNKELDKLWLEEILTGSNIMLLDNKTAVINKSGYRLLIAGADDWQSGVQNKGVFNDIAEDKDCVIFVSHSPETMIQMNLVLPMDMALTGHTQGGLVKLMDKELFNPLGNAKRYQSGWHDENGTKMLISEGLCGEYGSLRLGTTAQVHLITLHCADLRL